MIMRCCAFAPFNLEKSKVIFKKYICPVFKRELLVDGNVGNVAPLKKYPILKKARVSKKYQLLKKFCHFSYSFEKSQKLHSMAYFRSRTGRFFVSKIKHCLSWRPLVKKAKLYSHKHFQAFER